MGDLDGGDVVNPPNRVRKRSKRIMVNTYFYQFSNTIDNPVDCDEEVSVTKSDTPGKPKRRMKSVATDPVGSNSERVGTMDKPDVSKKSKKLKVTRPEDYVDALVKEDLVIGTPVSKKDLIYDSDFEDPMNKVTVSDLPKKKGLVRVKKESGIKVNGIKNVKYRNTGGLKTRTSPKTLFHTIGILNVNQKNAVREIGLERLLDMKLDGIPNKLGFFLVDNFDPKKMVLNATKGKIPITEQSVHNILGLPIGGIDLMSTNPDTRYGNIKTIWKKQFIKDRVRPTDLMYEIIKTNDHGFYFKLNFLVLVINVLAECSRTGYCNIGFLSHIKGVDMISKVDWCKYVIDCLEMSKCKWRRNSDLSFYAGSITYLTMLYVESTKCASDPGEDSHMPLTKWTLNLLRKRQVVEQKNGGIGSSMLREADPVPSPDQCKESSNAHEENMHHSDNTKQVCLKRLDHKISQATDLLLEVDSLMAEAREMFPGDVDFDNLKGNLVQMLKRIQLVSPEIHHSDNEHGSGKGNPVFDDSVTPEKSDKTINDLAIVDVTPINQEPLDTVVCSTPLSPFWTSPTLFREMDRASGKKSDEVEGDEGSNGDPINGQRSETLNIVIAVSKGKESNCTDQVIDRKQPTRHNDLVSRRKTIASPLDRIKSVRMESLEESNLGSGEQADMKDVMFVRSNSKPHIGTVADFDPPSFDLGLSPTQKGPESIIECVEKGAATRDYRAHCVKREKRLGNKLRSPYMIRAVSFLVTADECNFRDWVLRGIGGNLEKVFITNSGHSITRMNMQTIADRLIVSSEVIDGWAMVLNDDEKFRSIDSPRRYFFPTSVSGDQGIGDPGENTMQTYERFLCVIRKWCNNDRELISMRNVDLVIFPVVSSTLVYMVVFNVRHPAVFIIDCEVRDGGIEDLYDLIPLALRDVMVVHLRKEGIQAWEAFAEMDIEQKKTRWQVVENKIDRGVVLMRNMETYMGGDTRFWESGLYKESTKQKKQLKDLRAKYVTKMLLSDVNIRKSSVITDIERFIAMETSIGARKRQIGYRFQRYKV